MRQTLEGVVVVAALLLGVLLFRECSARRAASSEPHLGATGDPDAVPARPPARAVTELPAVKTKLPPRPRPIEVPPPPSKAN